MELYELVVDLLLQLNGVGELKREWKEAAIHPDSPKSVAYEDDVQGSGL